MNDNIKIIKRKAVQIFSEEEFDKKIKSGKKLVIKFGADPSRPDLHIGHSVPLRVLKQLQDMGHEIVFVIGDFTAMIGDPSGKSKTRPSLTFEETRKSAETYLEQATKILDKEKTKIVFNAEWLNKMNFEDVKERYLKIAGVGIPQDIPVIEVSEEKMNICDLLVKVGFANSKGEAKRMIAGNGVKINSVVETNVQDIISFEEEKIIQFGKNRFVKVLFNN